MGKAIRASAQDPTTAGTDGCEHPPACLPSASDWAWEWRASPAALISTLYAIQTNMGLQYTVIAMIVVVLGGLGSITGAVIGGVILGIVSQLVTYFQPTWTLIAYYVIFIVLLLVQA